MKLTVRRLKSDGVESLGHLVTEEEQVICVTLERPPLGNQHNISGIPAGAYPCRRRMSPHFKREVFQVFVPGRDLIEMHPANYVSQLEGCIGLGRTFADINGDGEPDITSSQDAFDKFMAVMTAIDEFTLEVIDPPQTSAQAVAA